MADLAAPRRGFTLEWGKALSWWWDVRHLLGNVDAVICVGREEYDLAAAKLPGQRVEFLPGGVDPAAFAGGDPARGRALMDLADHHGPIILCLGRLDRQKDQATLVAAWRALARPDAALVLAGPETSPGYGGELDRGAAGAAAPYRRPGNIAPAVVPDLLAAAALVVLPSRHEPFGLAVLEAWAAGRAVVAAAVGGPAWLLGDGVGGMLFPPGDAGALAGALAALLDDGARARDLGAGGRTRALERFTWDHHVAALERIYATATAAATAVAAQTGRP
jgi:glycosyltransferase involved in cell wall biosynthesis